MIKLYENSDEVMVNQARFQITCRPEFAYYHMLGVRTTQKQMPANYVLNIGEDDQYVFLACSHVAWKFALQDLMTQLEDIDQFDPETMIQLTVEDTWNNN